MTISASIDPEPHEEALILEKSAVRRGVDCITIYKLQLAFVMIKEKFFRWKVLYLH